MNFGDFAGLTVIMATLFGIALLIASAYRRRLAYNERRLDAAVHSLSLTSREAELEKRVRVLERIVTQGGTALDIAEQIEALRGESNERPISALPEQTLRVEAMSK